MIVAQTSQLTHIDTYDDKGGPPPHPTGRVTYNNAANKAAQAIAPSNYISITFMATNKRDLHFRHGAN